MNTTEFLKILPNYLGCQVQTKIRRQTELGQPMKALKARFVCFDLFYTDKISVQLEDEPDIMNQDIQDLANCKLILRSIDQITDEEKIQMNIICSDTKGMPTEPENWASKHVIYTINKSAQQINYLRSIGIDCDGLIEAGFAIKEETK